MSARVHKAGLAARIRSSAMISARLGQYDDLTDIAVEVDQLERTVVEIRLLCQRYDYRGNRPSIIDDILRILS